MVYLMPIADAEEGIASNVVKSQRGDDEDEPTLVLCSLILDVWRREVHSSPEDVLLRLGQDALPAEDPGYIGTGLVLLGIRVIVEYRAVVGQWVVWAKGECPDCAQHHRSM